MLSLISLAATLVPDLIRIIAGDKAGTIAASVAKVVKELTGTDDAVAAKHKLDSDPAAATALQQRLAEIALEATRAQLAEAAQQRQDELEAIRLNDSNTGSARTAMESMASAGSPIAWGAPIVSVVVSIGFFVVIGILVLFGLRTTDDKTVDIINIAVGVLGTGFATVVNFWLGSSSSARNKDAQVVALQADHAVQTTAMLTALQRVHDTHAESTKVAFAAVQHVAASAIEVATPPVPPAEPPVSQGGTSAFERCVAVTLAQEGGYVESPVDPGGATNFGITLAALAAWRGTAVTADDVLSLTRQEAIEIYRSNYWLPAGCAGLPPGLDLMVFDTAVNSGCRIAVKLLQKAVGVTDDGSLGPKTLAAVRAAGDMRALINRLATARMAFYRTLPTFSTFGTGWESRIRQVTAAALVMT